MIEASQSNLGAPHDGDGSLHRVARTVRDTDLAAYQRVVRTLLAEPYVGPSEKDRLTAIRRWESELRADLESVGRFRLEISPTAALLIRRPVVFDPHRPARGNSRPFDSRRYAYLCLLLSGLLSAGMQTLLSSLARQLADESFRIDGLGFDSDVFAQRQAFVDVIRWLVEHGVLRLRDGSASVDLEEDALYDLDHEAVHLIAPTLALRDLSSITERLQESFGESRDERRAQVRQRVLRLLLDRPFVLLDDLDDDERAWLQRNGARIEADLHRLTGMQVERRREGIALIDSEDDASARSFPRGGSEAQLALLLVDRLCTYDAEQRRVSMPRLRDQTGELAGIIDAARSRSEHDNDLSDPERPVAVATVDSSAHSTAPAWTATELEAIVTDLVRSYPGVRRDLRDDPAEATRLAVDELLALGLLRPAHDDAGRPMMVAMVPMARYRRILAATADKPSDQLGLFGDAL